MEDVGAVNISNQRSLFSKGTRVEVKIDEEGFEGAWYEAKIVKAVGKDKFRIEYERMTTEDGLEPLIEDIHFSLIRPIPPEVMMVDGYNVKEKVDVFYNDGWWEGEIRKIVADSKYKVYFQPQDEEMKFDFSDIRPHQDWIHGKWICLSF